MSRYLKFTDGRTINAGTMFCVASNYKKHADEMGTAVPSEPAIFIKPPQALVHSGDSIILPAMSDNVHHEVELVVVIGRECKNINRDETAEYVMGYAVGIDVTMRDVQGNAKKAGKPWAVAKGFFTSAPVSDIIAADNFDRIPDFDLLLSVNNEIRQSASTKEMERDVPSLIEFLSNVFTLLPGDLIFTGTPSGVGPIKKNDTIKAELSGFITLNVDVN